MRRLLSGGVLLSLGLVAAHAAVEAWAEARAVVELERLARALPDGARLAWTRLDAKPLRLALDVEGVRLDLPPGGPLRSLDIGALRLAQAGSGTDTIGAVGRFRATDLAIDLAEGRGKLRVAQVEGEEVEIRALSEALAGPEPLAALEALRLGPMRAHDVTLERDERRLELPRIAIRGYGGRRLEELELAGLAVTGSDGARGRLEELAIGLLDLAELDVPALEAAADDPLATFALLDRLRIERARVAGLDLGWPEGSLKLAGLSLGGAGRGRIEGFTIDGLALTEEHGGRSAIGRFALDGLDWSRVRPERLVAAAARLGEDDPDGADPDGAPADREEPAADSADGRAEPEPDDAAADEASRLARAFAGLELAGELLRLEVGRLRLEDLEAGDPGGGLSLARLAWDGLAARRFGAFGLAGFEARGENDFVVRLEALEQSAAAAAPIDLAERLEAAPRTAETLQELTAELSRLPWQSRTGLSGLALVRDGEVGIGLGRLALELAEEGTRKRTSLTLDELVVDPAVLGAEQVSAGLGVAGVERLAVRARLQTLYDQATQDVLIEDLALDVVDQVALTIRLAARLGTDPALDPVTASTDAELVRAELSLRDQGMVERWLARRERDSRKRRPELIKQLLRDLRSGEPGRSLLDSRRAAELERFLAKPGVLVIRLAPQRPVSFPAIFMSSVATPARAAQTLGLEIKALER